MNKVFQEYDPSTYKSRLLGRKFVVVTGLEGSGKTHFVMTEMRHILATTDKKVYLSNIDGVTLEHPNLQVVDTNFSWLNDAEAGSIVVYDEASSINRFDNSTHKVDSHEEITILQQRRHLDVTLVFINPNSKFLHIVIRDSAKYHFHFSNPFSDTEKTKCFIFSGCLQNTSNLTQTQIKSSIDEFEHILDKTVFPLYKSVNDDANHDTVKFENKKAKKLFFFAKIALFIAAVSLLIFFYYARSLYSDYNKNTDEEKEQQQEKTTLEKVSEVPELASKVFEIDMQQKQLQQQNERLQRELELYKQRLPQDYDILSSNDDLRVSAAMSFNNVCKAYNVRGDLLNISQSECEYILSEKGRMIASSSQPRTTTTTSSNTMLAPVTTQSTQTVSVPVTLQ